MPVAVFLNLIKVFLALKYQMNNITVQFELYEH